MIEAHDLAKSFLGRPAVAGISFEIGAGEIVGFLGTNGAGKSTTLRLLAGYLRPDRGAASIAGHDIVCARRQAQACLGYLPEAAAGFHNLTVLEFLTFAAESRGYWGARRRAALARAIEVLDLAPAMAMTLKTLSKGWRQRAWLAQAILHDPPVLILDEPTDGLDPSQKLGLRRFLRTAAEGRAILMSTHILEEAEQLCDRLIIISQGLVVADQARGTLTDGHGRLAGAFARLTDAEIERQGQ
jgi:ABC-2 type transport system ATP-binding protein